MMVVFDGVAMDVVYVMQDFVYAMDNLKHVTKGVILVMVALNWAKWLLFLLKRM
jgi:hypothetical protein